MKEKQISAEPLYSIIFTKIKMQLRYQICQDCYLTLVLKDTEKKKKDKSTKYFNLHWVPKIPMPHLVRPLVPSF